MALKTDLIIQATEKGSAQVTQAMKDLGDSIGKVMKEGSSTTSRLAQETDKLRSSIGELNNAVGRLSQSFEKSKSTGEAASGVFKNMQWSIKSFVTDMEKLIQIQLRWYGTRFVLDSIAQGFRLLVTNTFQYVSALDQAGAEMLRFSATSGTVTTDAVQGVSEAVKAMRQALIERPVDMKSMSDMAQAFVGAGIAEKTVAEMIPDLARLKTAFHEIDMKQFAVAVTAAFNTFKDQIQGAYSDAEKFKVIIETLLRGQAVGIIRPEEFTKVMQYMSAVSKIGGFSLQQMTAMSVAITDTGNRAATAGRLAASFMMALTQPKARGELEKIGLVLNRNISLADQFDDIAKQILKLSDISAGKVPMGVQSFLGGMMGREQMRAFISFLMEYDKFVKLTKELDPSKLGGALEKAADIMTKPIGAQWKILGNIVDALGVAITKLNETSLRNFVTFMVDVGRGILFAIDTSGTFTDKLYLLGDAGKNAYNFMYALKEVLSGFVTALSPFLSIVGGIVKAVLDIVAAFTQWEFGVKALTAAIVTYFIGKGLVALTASIATLLTKIGLLLESFPLLMAGFGGLATFMQKLAYTISTAFLPITVVMATITLFFSNLNKMLDEEEKITKDFGDRIFKNLGVMRSKEQAQAMVSVMKDVVAEAEKMKPDPAKMSEEEYNKSLAMWEAYLKGVKMELSLYESRLKFFEKGGKLPEKVPAGPPPPSVKVPEDTWRGHLEREISNIKKIYSARYDEISSNLKAELALLDEQHTYGLISSLDYEEQRLKLMEDAKDRKLLVLDNEMEALRKGYDKLYAELEHKKFPSGKERDAARKALYDAEVADITKLQEKITETENKFEEDRAKVRVKTWQERLKIAVDGYKQEEKLADIHNKMMENIEKSRLRQKASINEFNYSQGLVMASEYYEKEQELIRENLEEDLRSLSVRTSARDEALRQELRAVGPSSVRGMQIIKELDLLEEEYQERRVKYELDADDRILQLRLKMKTDMQALFETEGFWETTKMSFAKITKEFSSMGVQIDRMWKGVAQSMADTFETVFIDITKDNLKSFSDYLEQFFNKILDILHKIIAEVITGYIIAGVRMVATSYIGGAAGTGGGANAPAPGPGQINVHTGGLIPEFHVGGQMRGDERMAKVLTGERVMSREQARMFEEMYKNSKSGTNVSVNLHNETGRDMKAEEGYSRFDGEQLVVGIVLKDINSYGPIYQSLQGRR